MGGQGGAGGNGWAAEGITVGIGEQSAASAARAGSAATARRCSATGESTAMAVPAAWVARAVLAATAGPLRASRSALVSNGGAGGTPPAVAPRDRRRRWRCAPAATAALPPASGTGGTNGNGGLGGGGGNGGAGGAGGTPPAVAPRDRRRRWRCAPAATAALPPASAVRHSAVDRCRTHRVSGIAQHPPRCLWTPASTYVCASFAQPSALQELAGEADAVRHSAVDRCRTHRVSGIAQHPPRCLWTPAST